ncbi:MAG: WYL domain-containing protein [Ruminococcaceae bacterium]|nr:WYL domain-containing protein [Oscillospiraceae bacterium]
MEVDYNGNKGFRLISIYERLNKGEILSKARLAKDYNVTEKTVQRDIDDLRAYIAEAHYTERDTAIEYSKIKKGYQLVRFEREWLTNEEVVAMCKILLESRALKKVELVQLITKLLSQVAPNDRILVDGIIKSELHNYVPLKHNKALLSPIWELSQYISKNEIITFSYTRKDGIDKQHTVKPVAIMFSEYYFYLIAFMADDSKKFPTVFRIDRIENIKGTETKFVVPYREKFNDGEFRKRVQFMFSGELRRVIFEYNGPSIESVLDRLPTAEILSEQNGTYTVKVEVYGDGIDMWLRSQGDGVKVLT